MALLSSCLSQWSRQERYGHFHCLSTDMNPQSVMMSYFFIIAAYNSSIIFNPISADESSILLKNVSLHALSFGALMLIAFNVSALSLSISIFRSILEGNGVHFATRPSVDTGTHAFHPLFICCPLLVQ